MAHARRHSSEGMEAVTSHGMEAIPYHHEGLESVPAEYEYHAPGLQIPVSRDEKESLTPEAREIIRDKPLRALRDRHSSKKWVWIIALITFIVVLGVVLGIALGLTVGQHDHSSSRKAASATATTSPSPTSSAQSTPTNDNPTYLSTSGAFNGTGLAILGLGETGTDAVQLHLYFQHFEGQIRQATLVNLEGSWAGGDDSNIIVASNVLNGTPIATISYAYNGSEIYHVFYLDTSYNLQDVINSNNSNTWTPGLLGDSKFRANKDSTVGLAVCENDDLYGDNGSGGGMRLYYGSTDTTIQELSWGFGDTEWTKSTELTGVNGNGGIECRGVAQDPSYLFVENTDNKLELWYKSFKANANGNWTRGADSSEQLRPNSSIAFSSNAFFQDNTNTITGININESSAASSWSDPIAVGPGMPGTQVNTISTFPTTSGGSGVLHVYFQTNGSNIMEFLRDQSGGEWSSNVIPVGN
ncbi:MAG: hypothetical protein M1827_006176 [Pycnora praestabilis]|nr:MAG: hypothetical protein M1827_006176 [Pycnora praestabilis]